VRFGEEMTHHEAVMETSESGQGSDTGGGEDYTIASAT